MNDNTSPKVLSISSLLKEDKYKIPLYQRNFAWTEVETIQLLQDIWDKSCIPTSNYYIGTLIVDKKKEGGVFEIIDGQQRHTVITLINAVVKGISSENEECTIQKANLSFEARIETKKLIDSLLSDYTKAKAYETEKQGLLNIIKAVKDIELYLQTKKKDEQIKFKQFMTYFYENVMIIRVEIPDETDVNHYFEIMNNRGEQLEKHEILKAKFIESIKDKDLQIEFGFIWDACSQMDKHIQMCFEPTKRKDIFGETFTTIPTQYFKNIQPKLLVETTEIKDYSLINIINSWKGEQKQSNQDSVQEVGTYKSIIDFSNFLLLVLKLENNGISLDDKKLLDEFGYTKQIKERKFPDATIFIDSLLYYRTIFDKFIIKREIKDTNDFKWEILTPNQSNDTGYINTFKDEIIVMCQSMLHVSFPNNNYKNWLFNSLELFKEGNIPDETIFLKQLESVSRELLPKNMQDCYINGVYIPHYIFNYLDYLLWKLYDAKVKGTSQPCTDDHIVQVIFKNKDRFSKFRFTQNNSVEHMHPQSEVKELKTLNSDNPEIFKEQEKILNYFGNLCLISSSSNSKYNDYNFAAKLEQFNKRISIESLKQVIMFNNDAWNTHEIKYHGEEMIGIIEQSLR